MAKGKMIPIRTTRRAEMIKSAAKAGKIRLVKDRPKITGRGK